MPLPLLVKLPVPLTAPEIVSVAPGETFATTLFAMLTGTAMKWLPCVS